MYFHLFQKNRFSVSAFCFTDFWNESVKSIGSSPVDVDHEKKNDPDINSFFISTIFSSSAATPLICNRHVCTTYSFESGTRQEITDTNATLFTR